MGLQNKLYSRTGPMAFPTIGSTVALAPNSGSINDSIIIGQVEVGNSTGANASCGFGIKLPNAMWLAGKFTASSNAITNDTTDAQSTTASDFALSTLSTNNDGYMLQAHEKFNVVNLVIGTAQNGAGVAEYTYWNGSAFAILPTLAAPTVTSTGNVSLIFLTPSDWTPLVAADVAVTTTLCTVGMYALRVRYTTAPVTTAGLLTSIELLKLLDYYEIVPDGNSIVFNSQGEIRIPFRASLVPFCNVANAANWIDIEYRQGA